MSYLRLTGGRVTTPDAAALDIAGDLTVVAYWAADNWAAGVNQRILSKLDSATDGGYECLLSTAGLMNMGISDSTNLRNYASSATGYTNLVPTWSEYYYISATQQARFRKSSDPVGTSVGAINWATISTAAIQVGLGPTDSSKALSIGSRPGGVTPFTGKLWKLLLINGDPSGTVVASPDFTNLTPGTTSFNDAQGNTWTLTGNAAVVADVDPGIEDDESFFFYLRDY